MKILGAGCVRCRMPASRTRAALDTLGIELPVEMIGIPWVIADYGVMYMPALVVNRRVILTGKVPRIERLSTVIEGAIGP